MDIQGPSCENTESADDVEKGSSPGGGVLIRTEKSSLPAAVIEEAVLSNGCAICLESYQPGETVVSSMNAECNHVFHKECMIEYLAKKLGDGTETPCPMCRNPFCSEE